MLRKLPMLAHVDLRLSGSEGASDATRSAVQSLAMCSRLVRGLPGDTLCAEREWKLCAGKHGGDATRSAVQSLALCARLVRGLPNAALCACYNLRAVRR